MYIDDANKKFLINFFDTHHVWRVDNLPWVWFNYENGRMEPLTNNHVRVDYMFSEYGFFNEMIKELDPNYLDSKKRNDDFSYYHMLYNQILKMIFIILLIIVLELIKMKL